MTRGWRGIAVGLAAVLLAGCASGGGTTVAKGPAVTTPGPPITYVAVGASETVGYGADDPLSQSWPQVLFHRAFPSSTTFTNLGIPGATVADALTTELPLALSLHANVVTVWLNVNDALAQVPTATYEAQLDQLVHALRAGGKTTVLVANTPPLEELPAYLACRPGGTNSADGRRRRCLVPDPSVLPDVAGVQAIVAAYNTAIAAVCSREGATVVDLHALGAAAGGSAGFAALTGRDGFHPSTAGHAAVAAAFAATLATLHVLPPVPATPAPTATTSGATAAPATGSTAVPSSSASAAPTATGASGG